MATHQLPVGSTSFAQAVRVEHSDQVARVLPRAARNELIAAANHKPRSQRVTAINMAIIQVRKNYPSFFQEEQ